MYAFVWLLQSKLIAVSLSSVSQLSAPSPVATASLQLKHYAALSLILTAIVSLLLTIPTVAASRQFLILMKTPDNILGLADSYIKVIFAGILLTMSYNVAAGILRGIGGPNRAAC